MAVEIGYTKACTSTPAGAASARVDSRPRHHDQTKFRQSVPDDRIACRIRRIKG